MRITLNNTDIEAALIDYVQTMGINTVNCDFDIQTIKGRKTGDLVAEIDIIQRQLNAVPYDDTVKYETPKEVGARDEVETTQPLFTRPDTMVMDDVMSEEDEKDIEEGRSTGLTFLS